MPTANCYCFECEGENLRYEYHLVPFRHSGWRSHSTREGSLRTANQLGYKIAKVADVQYIEKGT